MKRWYKALFTILLLVLTVACLSTNGRHSTAPDFKVAFIGDQGLNEISIAVLQMIKFEEADMVLHLGDFDYRDDPDSWDRMISEVLGEDFPYFGLIGNHEVKAWPEYQKKLMERLDKIPGANCVGDLGVKSACTYKGLFFILSGFGTMGKEHKAFIREKLAQDSSIWRICGWHINDRLMQASGTTSAVGWGPYEECRKGGAIIATAHWHFYSRTHLIANFKNQTIASNSSTLEIGPGRTFAFVSGLGGRSIRGQNNEVASKPWWASVYSATQGANYGALFCSFNVNGTENRAHCYFRDVDGNTPDEFWMISHN
jgi:hypothetical protein